MKDLSVLIVSYNTVELTLQTIHTLRDSLKASSSVSSEIIVVDNGSTDGSVERLKKEKGIVFINNKKNEGFAVANNLAAKHARGKYLLLLNSDIIVDRADFAKLIEIMESRKDIGALTVKLLLPNGSIDPASHRGFPDLWRSFTYFSKLEHVTSAIPGLNQVFGGYHLTHKDLETEHEIDSPSGAFFLTRKELYDKIGGLDEAFFMYGEDIDLAFRLKKAGYKIWYYPYQSVVHIKGQSGRAADATTTKKKVNRHFYDAMKIFYKKHYEKKYPSYINKLVFKAIDLKS